MGMKIKQIVEYKTFTYNVVSDGMWVDWLNKIGKDGWALYPVPVEIGVKTTEYLFGRSVVEQVEE